MSTEKDLRRPNLKDLEEWEVACHYLNRQYQKCSYNFPNDYLVHSNGAVKFMRDWMIENDLELVFYSTGWGWRLRKGWEERIEKMRNDIIEEKKGEHK